MSQIADAKCVILELAYLEALDVLYAMECSATDDLEKLVLWSYRNDNGCTDTDEDCCIAETLKRYTYTAEDCTESYECNTQVTIEPVYCGDITISVT